MKHYRVILSDRAVRDLQSVKADLTNKSSATVAERITDALLDGLEGLSTLPERYQLLDPNDERVANYRRLFIKGYRICFFVEERSDAVYVALINHQRQSDASFYDDLP